MPAPDELRSDSKVKMTPRLLAVGALAAATLAAGITGMLPAGAAEPTSDNAASLVETYDYPGGDKVDGIRLIKGDGRIMLVGCDEGRTSAEVYSYKAAKPYCFEFKAATGFVTLELDEVYGIRNHNDFPIDAKIRIGDLVKPPVTVEKDDWKGVGAGAGDGQALLLELRAAK
ncbi:hypothetical protein QLQ12_30860 [Actinoplanes sp. NEAU-A12]|uniref:Secreted protein n=1 Tax=Actinoplanes sandaracinus TaxID=3045177 RepID=A0ABT6WTK5_9ACTN|nr:hypothetical protein [Actinoplanes sandaracinus]MDI6103024.1 hypothetical protein [Actinoplanes sandaracinus]